MNKNGSIKSSFNSKIFPKLKQIEERVESSSMISI